MVKLQELNKKTDQRLCSCVFLALTLVFASSYAVSLHYAAAGFVKCVSKEKKKEHYYSVLSFLVYLLVAFNIIHRERLRGLYSSLILTSYTLGGACMH